MTRRVIPWQKQRAAGYAIERWPIETDATGLLLLDLQVAHLDPDVGAGPGLRRDFPTMADYYFARIASVVLPAVSRLLRFFREHKWKILHARSGCMLPDCRDIAPWSWRAALVRQEGCGIPYLTSPDAWEREIPPQCAPAPGELVLDKHTLSPFNGTSLDLYLRNMGIENLVIAGVLTNGAVEVTARDAADRGYHCFVVDDGCAALTAEDHEFGTRYASWYVVKSLEDVLRDLG